MQPPHPLCEVRFARGSFHKSTGKFCKSMLCEPRLGEGRIERKRSVSDAAMQRKHCPGQGHIIAQTGSAKRLIVSQTVGAQWQTLHAGRSAWGQAISSSAPWEIQEPGEEKFERWITLVRRCVWLVWLNLLPMRAQKMRRDWRREMLGWMTS